MLALNTFPIGCTVLPVAISVVHVTALTVPRVRVGAILEIKIPSTKDIARRNDPEGRGFKSRLPAKDFSREISNLYFECT